MRKKVQTGKYRQHLFQQNLQYPYFNTHAQFFAPHPQVQRHQFLAYQQAVAAEIVRRQAVDMSPFRRVNYALYLLATGAREASFRNLKTMAECLAEELINAARGSSNSYAIKKKDEIERVSKSNR